MQRGQIYQLKWEEDRCIKAGLQVISESIPFTSACKTHLKSLSGIHNKETELDDEFQNQRTVRQSCGTYL